ncbi:hypothetical protein AB3N61_18295 [Leptospira sp. WS58.C1]|uniref:hypothetical protein n=1 Tax=Leptospira cinconiae TaxID=3235173 RepID=UPI00349E5B8F
MQSPNWSTVTESELWEYIAWHLSANGVDSVLVGGAVVSVYSDGIYKSGDLDIVYTSYNSSIGEDYQIIPDVKRVSGKMIKILSPTDCIKDRLASYIYFNARECLEQAILVAKRQSFNLKEIKRWCDSEGGKAKSAFEEFKNLL